MVTPLSSRLERIWITTKALKQLRLRHMGFYLGYQLGLRSGLIRRQTRDTQTVLRRKSQSPPARLFEPLDRVKIESLIGFNGRKQLLSDAEEILKGKVRLFGGAPVPLQLASPNGLFHWTEYERNLARLFTGDVKFVWEPARFSWAFTLARAYQVSGDEHYPAAFWSYLEEFQRENPAYQGLNWVSGQEVGLRLIGWFFCWQVFVPSIHSTADRGLYLAQAIAEHAARIPPGLVYAKAQNNNHLLSESAALYTAGLALPDYPLAEYWKKLGWELFHRALQDQIDEDGTYCQQSVNYHRLMLQLAMWVHFLAGLNGQLFPERSQKRLAAATEWLRGLVDSQSGGAPNLGPNDGAYIMPLSGSGQTDYRPVLQAAGWLFLRKTMFLSGAWDEMGAWYGAVNGMPNLQDTRPQAALSTLRSSTGESWAYLRAAHFQLRPGHADQLHLDLWWHGENIARDAGTFLYNAPYPWDNALMGADVHNTVTVDDKDQMSRVSRFLFLDWAQAHALQYEGDPDKTGLIAEHTGYHRLGVSHRRTVIIDGNDHWIIKDEIISTKKQNEIHRACLHWLLPDLPYEVLMDEEIVIICLTSRFGPIKIKVQAGTGSSSLDVGRSFQLVRGGELVCGTGESKPHWGWFSPTYGVKHPALSFRVQLEGQLPLQFQSSWELG